SSVCLYTRMQSNGRGTLLLMESYANLSAMTTSFTQQQVYPLVILANSYSTLTQGHTQLQWLIAETISAVLLCATERLQQSAVVSDAAAQASAPPVTIPTTFGHRGSVMTNLHSPSTPTSHALHAAAAAQQSIGTERRILIANFLSLIGGQPGIES